MGEQSKRLGLQFNFAPVLDINTNPKNPYRFPFFEKTSIKLRSEQ
jgi:beta-glucosidase-like glycosyl hydrolase